MAFKQNYYKRFHDTVIYIHAIEPNSLYIS